MVPRLVWISLFVWFCSAASWRVETARAAPGDGGIAAATLAAAQAGKSYLLGAPSRVPGIDINATPSFDCSGLIWAVHDTLYPGEQFPAVSQDQYYVGDHLAGTLWDGTEFPVGALLFLHDDDPDLGGGATHVSIYLGGGEAMDCYNSTFGCNIHNVVNDSYYRTHWLGATYPWGDNPTGSVPIGGAGGPISPAGVQNIITSPGATYQEFAPGIQAAGATLRAPVEFADQQTAGKDGAALANQQLGGFARVMMWARAVDFFMPMKLELAFLLVVIIYGVKVSITVFKLVMKLIEGIGKIITAGMA